MDGTSYKILGNRQIPGLRLQKTAYRVKSQSSLHSHENARFVFVLQGNFTEMYERKKRECRSLTMIVRPPHEKHAENYYGNGIVCLSVDIQPQWMARLRQYDVNLDYSADFYNPNLSALILKLNNEFDAEDTASALAVEALLLEISVEASRRKMEISTDGKIPRWLLAAKDYIHAEFVLNPTIDEIAAAASIHPVHLSLIFRRHFRCTIAEYIRRLRVESACEALTKSDESLIEIAFACGFSDQSHFSKNFKRIMNVTPAEYRNFMRQR
ncbi:MAG TPA: helix-turn-helix transcriptional regulator [Pyrinomonadaceae bacterium]|nr:helix-turn-helix transcriptional regulator [Pyrinomonadaceae bacterium]